MYFFTSLHLSEQLLTIVTNECMCEINLFFQQYHENKLHKTNTDSNNQKNAEYQI